jgi:hypothetical protein
MNKAKPEASYFFGAESYKVGTLVVNMQLLILAHPLFIGMGPKVEFHPVISFDELEGDHSVLSQIG